MNITEVITIALTSSLLSAGLTSIVSWLLQKNNYRNDYYKKILDKRIEAYEKAQNILSLLAGSILDQNEGKLCVYQLAMGKDHYYRFNIELFATIEKSFWLSPKTSKLLTELNLFFLHNIDNSINEDLDIDQQLIKLGIFHRDTIKQLRYDLQQQLYIDFASLHDISSFTKPKAMGKGYQVYYNESNKIPSYATI